MISEYYIHNHNPVLLVRIFWNKYGEYQKQTLTEPEQFPTIDIEKLEYFYVNSLDQEITPTEQQIEEIQDLILKNNYYKKIQNFLREQSEENP